MTRRILVTGGTGFVGRSVVGRLLEGTGSGHNDFEVTIWYQQLFGSFLNPQNQVNVLDAYQPEMVLHLAWHPTSYESYEVQLAHRDWFIATSRFADECLRRGVRLICAGSAADGDTSRFSHIGESNYAKYKRCLREKVLGEEHHGWHPTWLGIQYAFSMVEERPRVLRSLMQSDDKAAFTPAFPNHQHDFIEVNDVTEAICLVLHREISGDITIGSGVLVSTLEFVSAAKFHLGIAPNLPIIVPEKSGVPPTQLLKIGWSPKQTNLFFRLEANGVHR